MNTKKLTVKHATETEYHSAEFATAELQEMLDNEIRRSLIEADAGEFATKAEVKAVLQKWKQK